ncbi:MAG: hypothetical protein ACI8Q1_002206 [Parvicella sp.]|jgi:hypothetical protein
MDGTAAIVNLIAIVIRIMITVYCINKAEKLNRRKFGWGVFGFFLPIIAIIWIQFMKPNIDWEKQ